MMRYFFWIAFAVFLAASIPHVAYFFAAFEPSQGPEGVWWWAVSYAIAISIDVTIYLLSWTAFQRYRRYRTPKAVWQHWLLIVICTVFSWAVNWAYAKQFHNEPMLSSAETVAPWLINVFPFMASAFPLLGIVYTMMAETVTETAAEEKGKNGTQLTALMELARQTNLPLGILRRTLGPGGTRINPALLSQTARAETDQPAPAQSTAGTAPNQEDREHETGEASRPITGQIVAIAQDTIQPGTASQPMQVNSPVSEGSPDKLQMTIEILKANPEITDEVLAERLSLKRPASALFWRRKAIEILHAQESQTQGMYSSETWARPAGMNGKH